MKKRALRCILSAAGVVLTSGCGVMFGGTSQTIRVSSSPSRVELTTLPSIGTLSTPASVTLQRKNSYLLTASMDGYRPAEYQIRQEMRTGPLILDLLFTGLVGIVVDAVTGGWWNLAPRDVNLVLERIADAGDAGPDEIEVHVSLTASGDTVRVESDVPGVHLDFRRAD